ncbi:MAG TPA: ROK family transcriptional regulator [Candidatus Saccharimonadales bacterium]|nr:ROK family transcriptional regulator [Candidatus Saccharimonadales bacterium]
MAFDGQTRSRRDGVARAGLDIVRRHNLSTVLRRIHTGGQASRSDLAAYTGLNRSTVGALVGDLVARDLVRERPGTGGAPGRPSPVVESNPDGISVLALEVFADSLAAARIGIGGRVLARIRIDRPRQATSPESTVRTLAAIARQLLEPDDGGRSGPILAIGIAVAGVVRHGDGLIVVGPNLAWRDVPLARLVASSLDLDAPVLVGNDADLAALAEHVRGAGVGSDDFICLWGEVGVGAGVIAGGRPLTGVSGFAGEVGHLPLNPTGVPCHCGSSGCWETEIGEDALLRQAGVLTPGGGRPAVDAVLDAASRGDPLARQALDSVGRWTGIGIAALANAFNPERIALGGLFSIIDPFTRSAMERAFAAHAMPATRGVLEVVTARLGIDGPLLGAAELALDHALADPASVPYANRSTWPTGESRSNEGKHEPKHEPKEVTLGTPPR